MSSLKVSNAINKLIFAEKIQQFENLKTFFQENVDEDDFSFTINGEEKNITDFFDILDTFSSTIDKKMIKMKTTKKTTPKKMKKKTFYNHWLAERLSSFSKEQALVDESVRVDNKDRMKVIGPEWKAFKESDVFEEQKSKWEQENMKVESKKPTSPKKKSKNSTKKSKKVIKPLHFSDSDSDSDSDIENE